MESAPRLRVPPLQLSEEMDFLSNTISKARKATRPVLLSFNEMPEWFRRESNQWIHQGYLSRPSALIRSSPRDVSPYIVGPALRNLLSSPCFVF
ncbi:hypothetical protein BJY00DRAFT_82349 [Aspergillus carlsbadensis]|nr:hypothetical protein BJY00DRAFT_82349 [Aspergillus carlsbadensis]